MCEEQPLGADAALDTLATARRRLESWNAENEITSRAKLFNRHGTEVPLAGTYRGHSAFLVCGGPSLLKMDLSLLSQRGILTMAVNNAAVVYRPHLWCCADDPGNFCDAIWYDPGILKFLPDEYLPLRFTIRDERDDLVYGERTVGEMPAVFGFKVNEEFVAERWLYEETFNWGNDCTLTDANGEIGSRSIMYIAIKLLYHLGVRRIFLLGCDFRMRDGARNYAFEQDRSPGSVEGNNNSYRIMNIRFRSLLPYFEKEGLEIFNCTPNSGLTAFPAMRFETAIAEETVIIPKRINTAGMYDRMQRERDAAAAKELSELSDGQRPENRQA
jgi:hypothetical protein